QVLVLIHGVVVVVGNLPVRRQSFALGRRLERALDDLALDDLRLDSRAARARVGVSAGRRDAEQGEGEQRSDEAPPAPSSWSNGQSHYSASLTVCGALSTSAWRRASSAAMAGSACMRRRRTELNLPKPSWRGRGLPA